jgi:hypothetical protein
VKTTSTIKAGGGGCSTEATDGDLDAGLIYGRRPAPE